MRLGREMSEVLEKGLREVRFSTALVFFFFPFFFSFFSLEIGICELLILCFQQVRVRLYQEWDKELARQYPVSDMAQMPQFLGWEKVLMQQ